MRGAFKRWEIDYADIKGLKGIMEQEGINYGGEEEDR